MKLRDEIAKLRRIYQERVPFWTNTHVTVYRLLDFTEKAIAALRDNLSVLDVNKDLSARDFITLLTERRKQTREVLAELDKETP